MLVMWINNAGGGFAGKIETKEGITVGEFFAEQMPDCDPANYKISLNRQPCASDEVLKPGDRISAVPTKIQGEFAA